MPKTPLMSMVVKQALSYLGHVMRAGGLEAATVVGKVAGTRRRGRQRRRWLDWVTLEAGKQLGDQEAWRNLTRNVTRSQSRLKGAAWTGKSVKPQRFHSHRLGPFPVGLYS